MTAFDFIKKSHYSKSLIILLLTADILVLILSFRLSYSFFYNANAISNNSTESLLVIFVLAWVIASLFGNIYHIDNLRKLGRIALVNFFGLMFSAIISGVYILWLYPNLFSPKFIFSVYALSYVLLFTLRFLELKGYKFLRSLKNTRKNIVVIGYTLSGKKLYNYFKDSAAYDYNFLGFFDDEVNDNELVLGKLNDIQKFCIREDVDEIYYALPNHAALVDRLAKFADENYMYFGLVQDIGGLSNKKIDTHLYDDGRIPIVTPRRDPLRFFFNQQVKRMFDIFFSAFVIFFIFPFIVPIVAFFIKIDSKGPVFFKQLRSGKNGKPFWCYKFRTMTVNSEADSKQATVNDSRVTKIGKILRKTSLDEIPQFYNVLIGEMSVVGPRPHMLKHTEEYSAIINNFNLRHFINSGITGYAQVNGYRGETKNNYQMEKRVMYDNWYLENWSLTLDIKIIIKTVVNAFKGEKNAY
ncbi:putative colanic acid biosynthesis UDP-glucose lipid carrier transferase [Catalinimonas alkaloidigena]|uniref:undecaprenyl-phosphate glucose phosphotransferase n=1 Tax=Catalinimonas alkaloidigena TaxID=1075417 RepID=UPI002406C1AB|nr:undecaprenyl-phosphate glucose phosphotransferase [Catalinimonas alkaloidigena]MDF9797682.1 putative colanic acid biosynthesis UDP-glucose lipid carrier transferase [Catalinimonas alkaloidigena]